MDQSHLYRKLERIGSRIKEKSRRRLAQQIHDYIRDRASVEGMGFELSVNFFAGALARNAGSLFGVEHDGKRMIRDLQEPAPGYFQQWLDENSDSTG